MIYVGLNFVHGSLFEGDDGSGFSFDIRIRSWVEGGE